MTNQDLRDAYTLLNDSFDTTMVYHMGIDAGFFAEYTYMLNAMIYCLMNKVKFTLYSDDANFGARYGWEDYFLPFCPVVHDDFHHRYNYHRLPSLKVMKNISPLPLVSQIKWKAKTEIKAFIGKTRAFLAYGKPTLINHDVRYPAYDRYVVPELGIDGDYLSAFRAMVDITWCFNADTAKAYRRMADDSGILPAYAACQLRGGDKVTETELQSPDYYLRFIEDYDCKDVFVLTDDYRLYDYLTRKAPQYRWHTFCQKDEHGYVNSSFAHIDSGKKRAQMTRLLSSVQIMMHANPFIGSITNGPSFFLLKYLYPDGVPVDTDTSCIPSLCQTVIKERSDISKAYMRKVTIKNMAEK